VPHEFDQPLLVAHLGGVHLQNAPAAGPQTIVAFQIPPVLCRLPMMSTVVLHPHPVLGPGEVEPGHEAAVHVVHDEL
jgi:hypothetical protein